MGERIIFCFSALDLRPLSGTDRAAEDHRRRKKIAPAPKSERESGEDLRL